MNIHTLDSMIDSLYDMDCGSCGESMSWIEFVNANLLCPHCGWDSVRFSHKHPLILEPPNAGQDDWRKDR